MDAIKTVNMETWWILMSVYCPPFVVMVTEHIFVKATALTVINFLKVNMIAHLEQTVNLLELMRLVYIKPTVQSSQTYSASANELSIRISCVAGIMAIVGLLRCF